MTLQEWFDSKERDYGLGLALLGTHSKNRMLLQNLSRKQNPKKVEYELQKALDLENAKAGKKESHSDQIIDKMNGAPQKIEGTSRAHGADMDKIKVVRENHEVKYDDLPEEIQKKWDENRNSYKEIRATHEKLKLMEKAPAEDRAPLIARIDELDVTIRKNWDLIDAWEPGTEVPIKKEDDPATIAHKRINANRKYISTNTKKLAEETDSAKAEKLRVKIQERVTELKAAGEELKPTTVEELKKLGIEC